MALRIAGLDGWRAISAALVIVAHMQQYSALRTPFFVHEYGVLGVEYFFGISGFVITRGVLASSATMSEFYIKRAFRILPPLLLYLGTLIVLLSFRTVPSVSWGAMRGLLFVCDAPGGACGGWLGAHLWSLSVEEQFYLVLPLLMLFVRSKRALTLVLLAVPTMAVLLRAVHLNEAGAFLTNFTVIATGVMCALNEGYVLRIVRVMPVWLILPAIVASVVVLEINTRFVAAFAQAFVLGPLIMFTLLATTMQESWLNKALSAQWITTLGAATYSIYLFQQLATADFPFGSPLFYVSSISACVLWGMLAHSVLELPAIRLGRVVCDRLKRP